MTQDIISRGICSDRCLCHELVAVRFFIKINDLIWVSREEIFVMCKDIRFILNFLCIICIVIDKVAMDAGRILTLLDYVIVFVKIKM